VEVATTNVDGPGDSDVPIGVPVEIDGVKVWYFRSPTLRRTYWSPGLEGFLRGQASRFEIVHTHSVFLWPTWAAARHARAHAVPYVVSPRGMLVRDLIRRKNRLLKTAWITLFERTNLEAAAAVHFTSAIEESEARRLGIRFSKTFVVPNGVEPDNGPAGSAVRADVREILEDRSPFVLFVGRVNWKKGLDRLIPAMKRVPFARLVIAGNDEEGYLPSLRALASREGVGDRVRFLGPVQGGDKRALFAAAAVFALPSYSENFGNAALEAMAAGVPVVLTPEVGLAADAGACGAGIVTSGEPEPLGAEIGRLLRDESLRKSMGDRGRVCAIDRFAWDAVARRMRDAYTEVLRK